MRNITISETTYQRLKTLDEKLENTDLPNQHFYHTTFSLMIDLLSEVFGGEE